MSKINFEMGTRVKIIHVPEDDVLFEKTGTVVGISFLDVTFCTASNYIVLLDETIHHVVPNTRAVSIIEPCLEAIK